MQWLNDAWLTLKGSTVIKIELRSETCVAAGLRYQVRISAMYQVHS